MKSRTSVRRTSRDWLFVLPAGVVVAVMTQIPFVLTLALSTVRWILVRPDLGIKFVGLENYVNWLKISDFPDFPLFYRVLWQTVELTVISLAVCTVLGFLLSILLDNEVPGKNIARTLILGPFFVMATASGVVWKTMMFNPYNGWYGAIAKTFGVHHPVALLSYHPMFAIILLFSWQWTPFFVLVMLGGLQGISPELYDSMHIDGANWWQATFRIKLPLIANYMQVALMLGLIFIAKTFGLILVTTAGGPGTQTYNLPYAIYMKVFNANQVGQASSLSVMTVIITLAAVNVLYQSIRRRVRV